MFLWRIFSSHLLLIILCRRDIVWTKHSSGTLLYLAPTALLWLKSCLLEKTESDLLTWMFLHSYIHGIYRVALNCLAGKLKRSSWKQHESCMNLHFSFTWCYWGLWTDPRRENLYFQTLRFALQESPFFPLKKPCTFGIIHRRLHAVCIPVKAYMKASENQKLV